MSDLSYDNFDLIISQGPAGSGSYTAKVSSAGGNPSMNFRMPFSAAELDDLRAAVAGPVRDIVAGQHDRSSNVEYRAKVRVFGERLYDAIFVNQIRTSKALCLQKAQANSQGIRIRIRLDGAPELADLPWEYLYDRDSQIHLALWDMTPVVRHLDLTGPSTSLLVKPPINILVVTSAPTDLPPLDGDAEWQRMERALAKLVQARLVTLTRLPTATLNELSVHLTNRGPWHVFHFIGHGGREADENVLWFEDGQRRRQAASVTQLQVVLRHYSLRLAVLNSCEGARSLAQDPFTGVAQSLLSAGIPMVVAMQFKITDAGAIKFAHDFYTAIADNLPIDLALVSARKLLFAANNPTEWGTPVLFMCGDDGRIFQIDRPTEQQLRERQIKALSDDARAAIDAKRYGEAIKHLQDVQTLIAQ